MESEKDILKNITQLIDNALSRGIKIELIEKKKKKKKNM